MTTPTTTTPLDSTAQPSTLEAQTAGPDWTAALTAHDRCDAGGCGAQARVRVATAGGGQLLFCRHHGEALREKLAAAGAVLHPQYETLT